MNSRIKKAFGSHNWSLLRMLDHVFCNIKELGSGPLLLHRQRQVKSEHGMKTKNALVSEIGIAKRALSGTGRDRK